MNGLYEAAGLLGAVILCQTVQWVWDRYYARSSEADSDSAAAAAAAVWRPNDARVRELISSLQLTPHVEGGFYRRIYEAPWILRGSVCIERAAEAVASSSAAVSTSTPTSSQSASTSSLPMHFPRALSSCIYFLLSASSGPRSHFHRLPHAEELWFHIEGDPLIIAQIDEQTGEYSERVLGPVRMPAAEEAAAAEVAGRGRNLFVQPSATAPMPTATSHLAAFASPVDALQLDPTHARLTSSDSAASSSPLSSLSWPTHVVRPGCWFGARLEQATESGSARVGHSAGSSHPSVRHGYSLVCCSVTPAFQFEDFELMKPDELARLKVIPQMKHRMEQQQLQQQQHSANPTSSDAAAADSWSEEQRQELLAEVERMVLRESNTGAAPNDVAPATNASVAHSAAS